ncbi:MAG: glycosyltransferase family 2 protein [Syntrophobacteraceae bacterium]
MAPKISVCIPTYNYGHYISSAVESVLNQHFTDFELIIVDDCSKDNTEEVVSRFLYDKRVLFEKNERNLGLVGNWNKCLSKARGEYIKFVFADDMLASDKALGRMAGILDSDPSVSLVASARHLIDSESGIIGLTSGFPQDFIADGPEVINRCLRVSRDKEYMNLIGEPTVVMFRRADCARGFDDRYYQIPDLEMWFHLLEKGRFAFTAEPLASFRIHPGQKTRENDARVVGLDDHYLLFKEYFGKSYVHISSIIKFHRTFDQLYCLRKFGKKGVISREEATRRILAHCSYWRFYCYYPIHKVMRLFFKIGRAIDRNTDRKPDRNHE